MPGSLRNFRYDNKSIVTDVFVETGTYRGETVENALQAGFPLVHSIEVFQPNYDIAKERLKDRPNVNLYLGSSPKILKTILDRSLPTTFWLDAHYQGHSTEEQDPAYGQCPTLAELDVIFSESWKVLPIILIDDAFMFDGSVLPDYFDVKQWPTMAEIKSHFPDGYDIKINDQIIYCIPNL